MQCKNGGESEIEDRIQPIVLGPQSHLLLYIYRYKAYAPQS